MISFSGDAVIVAFSGAVQNENLTTCSDIFSSTSTLGTSANCFFGSTTVLTISNSILVISK